MDTSRQKIDKIISLITGRFGIEHINLLLRKIDVKKELMKKVAHIDDSELDGLLQDIKKVIDEH